MLGRGCINVACSLGRSHAQAIANLLLVFECAVSGYSHFTVMKIDMLISILVIGVICTFYTAIVSTVISGYLKVKVHPKLLISQSKFSGPRKFN